MNKVRHLLMRIRSVISVQTYKRPFLFVMMIMIALNLMILLIASIVALLIDDTFKSLVDAFVNGSLKWMLTPNAILEISSPNTLLLAVIVLITGLVLFSGTIIALTTNQIRDFFDNRKSGAGKIHLVNHIVILNWNNKVPELIADLIHLEHMATRVIVLADEPKASMEKSIMNVLMDGHQKPFKSLAVLVKEGSPLLQENLANVSISNASAIIVMNTESYTMVTRELSQSDLNVIKTVLTVGRATEDTSLTLIAEVKSYATKDKIMTMHETVLSLKNHTILPVCFDRRLGQIIAQTIINPLMEPVYLSLFSFEGSEIYRVTDTSFESCLKRHPYAIPLGTIQNGVFVLAKDDISANKSGEYHINNTQLDLNFNTVIDPMTIIIVGKNNKLPFILEAFKEYEILYDAAFNVHHYTADDIESAMNKVKEATLNTVVLLLSDEKADGDSLDANVINNLLNLQKSIKAKDNAMIVELLDPKNDAIIRDFNIHNTIISNKIISLLLSKLALFPDTALFYEQLLSFEINSEYQSDNELVIHELTTLFNTKLPLTFQHVSDLVTSFYTAANKQVIPIGLYQGKTLIIFSDLLETNPSITLRNEDKLVCMNLYKRTN